MSSEIIFNPSPELTQLIFERWASPAHSLTTIAADHDTTLEALVLWATRPDIKQRLALITACAAERAQQAAICQLHGCVDALATTVHAYVADERKMALPNNLEGALCRDKLRTGARRAAHLMHRIARTLNITPPPTDLPDPTPAKPRQPAQVPQNALRGLNTAALAQIANSPAAAALLNTLLATLIQQLPQPDPVPAPVPSSSRSSRPSRSTSSPGPDSTEPVPDSDPNSGLKSEISNFKSEIPSPIPSPSCSSRPSSSVSSPGPDSPAGEPLPTAPQSTSSPSASSASSAFVLSDSRPADLPSFRPSSSATAALATRSVFDTPATSPNAPTLSDAADNYRALDPARPFRDRFQIPEHHLERLKPCRLPPHEPFNSS